MNILIVDDHPLFRAALTGVVQSVCEGTSVSEAESYAEAIACLRRQAFDLVLLDLLLPGMNGTHQINEMIRLVGDHPLVVVSGVEDPKVVADIRQCGAAGFIAKSLPPQGMAAGLKVVLDGGRFFPEQAAPPPRSASAAPLTPKQNEVLDLLVLGKSNKEIANDLKLSTNTVKVHVTDILRKLRVSSRAQAIAACRSTWQTAVPQ